MTPYQQRTLPNGLRLFTVPLHDTQAVTVFVFAKVGSRYERASINGLSHFIEHLMFKGTTKHPTAQSISKLLDGVGAGYNAFTSKDSTGFYVKVSADHTTLAIDIVSDILQHSKFDAAEIERERNVIIEEIKMYDENPLMTIEDLFEAAVFGEHHQLGRTIQGTKKIISTVKRSTIVRYRDQFYHAGNMIVIVSGKLPEQLDTLINHYFGSLRRRPSTPAFPRYHPGKLSPVRLQWKDLEQAQVGLGTRAYRYNDRRLPIVNVLSIILGGNMSSRLFREVRERRGLAYDVSASSNPFEDTGCFMVHAGLEKDRIEEALRVIIDELRKLKTTRVGPAELKRAKEFLRGRMILSLEDSDSLASWYGRQALFSDTIRTPNQALDRLSKVTAADIQRVARDLFRPANMRLAVIGPYKDATPFLAAMHKI